jgi:hypothetical protein
MAHGCLAGRAERYQLLLSPTKIGSQDISGSDLPARNPLTAFGVDIQRYERMNKLGVVFRASARWQDR